MVSKVINLHLTSVPKLPTVPRVYMNFIFPGQHRAMQKSGNRTRFISQNLLKTGFLREKSGFR
jgi:hypothetical protein